MRQNLRKRKPCLVMRAAFLALCALIFVVPAKAQTNVYMHSGTQNVTGTLNFYDSGGASSVDGSYYWEKWYQHNENATIVFKNGTSPIQVTFGQFHAWGDKADGTVEDLGLFSLRVNNDHLYVYDGENADDSKLICDLTGTLVEPFTLTANGPITFKFVSDGQYRDEGWAATVTSTNTYTVQQPIITKEVCSDYVIIYNTANGGQVYYTTDGNDPVIGDPLTGATLYNGPFSIDLDDQSASVKVKAIVVAGDNTSAVASHTFTHSDQRPTPGAPVINIDGNTVTFVPDAVPAGLNETYNIRYTTNGTEPSATNGTLLTQSTGFSIEWHTPNTTFKAVTVAVTCSNMVSAVTTEQFGNVTVPTPTITFDGDGKAHIVCALDGATIYYTTDGTQPTASHYTDMGTTPVTTMALPIGTTVYAYAVFNAQGGGYTDSAIGSATYVPAGGNGTYGGVVFLDDREDHTWSYYSDDEQPIHSLKPIDVKITYSGFGDNTMTSTSTENMPANSAFNANVNSSQVAVNVGEPGNQFIYLKTLEATNADGSGDYPYTMIANPFQVRPLYNSSRGNDNANAITYTSQSITNEVRDHNGNIVAYTAGTSGAMTPMASIAQQSGVDRGNRDISVDVVSGGTNTNQYVPLYTNYCDYGFVSQYLIPASYFTNAGISVGDQLTSITLYQSSTGNWVAKNLGIWMGSTTATSFTSNAFLDEGADDTNVYYNESYSSNSASSHTFTFSTPFVFTGNNVYIWIQAASGGTYVNTNWRGISTNNAMGYYRYYSYNGSANSGSRQYFIPNTTFTYAPAGPRTITAVAGTNISTAYVAEGSTFPAGTTTTTLQVESGNSVTFQATPNSNFAFGGWYDENNNLVSTNATYTCTVTRDLTLTAKGLPTYTVNAVAGENINTAYVAVGSSFSGTETSVTVAEGGSATFQATVNSGYLFGGWYDEQGMKVSSNTTYTVENITGNFTLTAKAKVPHTVTIASTSNGTVTANPTTAGEGSTINLTVTPNSGYAISSITVTGTSGNTYVVSGQGTSYTFTMPDENVTVSAVFFQKTAASYRGFYAWRVKNMSSGLSIKVGNNTYTSANIANGIILYPDQEIQFAAEGNSTGNEVEFEALWARAWVNSTSSSERATNSGNYKNAYERNFKVGTSITTYSYPVTLSTLNPDGSGTLGSVSYNNNYSCSSDVKFENMTLNLNNNYLNGNNHSLHIGRGVSRGNNNVASSVYGYYNPSGDINGFTLRIESGRYTNAYLFYYSSYRQISSSTTWNMILGSDYDRANEDNSKLTIAGPTEVSYHVSSSSTSAKISVTGLSGTFGTTAANTELYMGYESRADANSAQTPRTLVVYGGEYLGGIAGGIEDDVTATTEVLKMRIYGGTVHQKVYGAGQYSAAVGTRRTIITGGTYDCWIAGGCYGTEDSGGATNGDVYVYFGGDANQTNTGGIYGAGYGTAATSNNSYTVNKSFVVVADDASAAGSVYGGGNNGYCTGDTEVWVLGGGEEKLTVSGSVYGGANLSRSGGANTVTMKGGTVNGSVYGGAQGATATTDIVYVTNLATVNIKGGNVKNNVFGGGLGASTVMRGGTNVTVSGGTVKGNVYGGGEQGTVGRSATYPANTSVTISGGSVNDVYGAGMGTSSQRANITGSTAVSVEGGTVNGSVYGGGQNGTVAYNQNGNNNTNYNSTVGVSGGEVKGNVYGGGRMGTSQVATFVNISDGIIRGHVFGGAEGEQKKVFVTGMRTVNMTGGHVYGNVYGGSQNANDGNNTTLTDGSFTNSNETATMCVTNISGGVIDENLYAAGYFGNCFGSVYVFIGKDAIENAPYKQPTTGIDYRVATLSIGGTVWAGGDWGTFSGTFGSNTISGNSNIYVDGNGYETTTQQANNAQYMNIGGSILGCGTSCHAGKAERTVIVRNYGTAQGAQPTEASRTLYSIQFAKVLILDNSNINFTGQGRINDLNQTEKYSVYEIYNDAKTTPNADTDVDGMRIVNGTGIFLNAPITQIANFRSMSCDNTFASTTPTLTGYTLITPETLSSCNNQVRVNGGNYIEIKWGSNYGALLGYSHMMASNNAEDGTCAYARPRWETNASFGQGSDLDNPNDGGWISYTASENTFALNGTAGNVQMPYENHTVAKNGEQYFRIWRQGGTEHYREGVFNAHASGSDAWKTVDVVITLPAFRNPNNYYCFETNGDATTIDYGADVLMWNAARETGTGNDWMYFNEDTDVQMTGQQQSAVEGTLTEMKKNADVNFGLVILPSTGMAGSDYIICYESDNNLALPTTKYTKADNTKEPQVTFRLTYYDKLTSNMTWDPSSIVLVQKDATTGEVVDRVTISLAVSTSSTIEQTFTTQLYAIMQGKGSTSETFNAKVVLPTFAANLYQTGVAANFTLNSVDFEPANGGVLIARGGTYNWNQYAVGYAAGLNYDNTDGWNGEGNYTERDSYPLTQNNPNAATLVGKTGGRSEFAIDFTLHYDGSLTATTEELIGTLTFNITFDNYKNAQGQLVNNQPLTIVVEVYRRGQGNRFYIDGINGSNANDARHPDKAVKQLSTIFNRCGYMAGDEIYIVNQVTASKQLNWNGLPYNNVIIYRYNGGHELSATDASIVGNPNNTAYLGNLLNVTNHMTMTGITLDGYYNNGETTYTTEDPETHEQIIHDTDENGGPHTVTATASMITIANGGTLELSNGTVLFNNNSSSVNGSAVNVANGGKLMMNQDATIRNNVTTGDGGGVYMAGTIVVSDDIQIVNNMKGDVQNNVFLTAADKMITIGTAAGNDAYGPLSADAKIGVTKSLTADIDNTYTRVVNVDQDVEWLETPFNTHPNSIIYHDGQKYQLVKYTDPKILYWLGTWVTYQDHVPTEAEGGWIYPADITSVTNFDIYTQYQYAWIISLVNGENGQPGNEFVGKTVNILADLDMDESIWVPIGDDRHPFKGTINGNGHLIENMHSPLVQDYMGMIGKADGAIIKDVMAMVNFNANAANMGAVAGVMTNTTISNVEAAGTVTGGSNTVNMGGIAGNVESGTIHSSFAVCDLTGTTETVMGGLVGTNGGDLYNSYANVNMEGSNTMGGLVGENMVGCHVENCYVNLGQMEIPAFAYENHGFITYCYASKAGQYVSADVENNVAPTKSGIFAAVKDRKHLDYMYRDNIVTAPSENTYANHEGIEYTNNTHAPLVWNGLLSVLNEWVDKTEVEGDFSPWYRPTSQDINGDLPVLAFPKDNCMGNYAEEEGKFLRYSASDEITTTTTNDVTVSVQAHNGLDNLLTKYSGKAANIFLYNSAIDVTNGSGNANLFINEDAALLQKATDGVYSDINATVGVTFDNSCKSAQDYWGHQLAYDWHMMSTPLKNAKMGTKYNEYVTDMSHSDPALDWSDVKELKDSYFPNGLLASDVAWDFYTYFEPQYHWINFKRDKENHFHFDLVEGVHANIEYTGLDQGANDDESAACVFTPGKGYMMAISQDTYMSSNGILNTGGDTIVITNQEPDDIEYNKGWNLVGNPYQAYLDLTKVSSTMNQFYIYDAEQGTYVPYTVGQSANSVTPPRFIHPHQAFFVYSAATSSNYVFDYTWATAEKATDGSSYFRGGENQLNYPLVNLFVKNQQGNRDLTIIEFNRPELGGATKVRGLRNSDFRIAAGFNGREYGILFTPEGTEKVPVHFKAEHDGIYTMTWGMENGNFTNLRLIDNKTGVNYDMLANDSYTFEASADDYASRFYITYTVTGLDEEISYESDNFAFFNGSEWIINGQGHLDVIDMTGRVLYAAQLSNDQNKVNLDGFAKGVYLLRVIDNKVVRTQKIIVR